MEFIQGTYAFPPQHQAQMFYPALAYPQYMVPPQPPLDDFYPPYGSAEYADLMAAGMLHDDFRDMDEVSTRPRLTKEQVEILEAQYQANHKPNSQVKRQLALQTNLKFQRVGNWFQNRRAKAKQQKRQEEFEAQNAASKAGPSSPSKSTSNSTATEPSAAPSGVGGSPRQMASPSRSIRSALSPSKSPTRSPAKEARSTAQSSPSPAKFAESIKEASWASLQRALGQAKAAQFQHLNHPKVTMAPPDLPLNTMQLPLRPSQHSQHSQHHHQHHHHHTSSSLSHAPKWASQPAKFVPYPSPITFQDNGFDFGFDDDLPVDDGADPMDDPTLTDFIQDSFVVTPEDWQEPFATPKGVAGQTTDPTGALPSPGLTMPSYPNSRRESTTEELSNNFGNFALAGSSPRVGPQRRPSEPIRPPQPGPLDIAARRKRPRPAPLTSSSLRSRSYGALTSASPTFRPGVMTPSMPHAIRHVKSAGQGLNARYAGIRKASSAQRSPMCVNTFAEAEAFNQLMAQQALAAQSLADLPAPLLSPDLISNMHMTDPEKNPFFTQHLEQFAFPGAENLTLTTASPHVTPLVPETISNVHAHQSLIPPGSAPAQFASFPDCTPPYSAGPLTNSSLSDAPLTSPELPSFPPVTYVPSLGLPQSCDGLNAPFQQFVLPSEKLPDPALESHADQKKTEFCIQEFPNQKKEHAHVASQLSQQRPKNYVFANTAPQDYTAA